MPAFVSFSSPGYLVWENYKQRRWYGGTGMVAEMSLGAQDLLGGCVFCLAVDEGVPGSGDYGRAGG